MTSKAQRAQEEAMLEDIRLVATKRAQRAGKPGCWRVFINDDGNVVLEILGNE